MKEYYYEIDGQVVGPVPRDELDRIGLGAEVKICELGTKEWGALGDIDKARQGKDGEQDTQAARLREELEQIIQSCSTVGSIPGRNVVATNGIVCGEAIMGTNLFRDVAANIRDIVGGQSGAYESELRKGRGIAISQMVKQAHGLGCNAVIGVSIDYETVGKSMLMVVATGTAAMVE